MASVERAMAMAAAALLPGLLPSPPKCTMITPCIIILPATSNPKYPVPGRADAVERWDAHKNHGKKPGSPASSSSSSSQGSSKSSSSSTNPGRAPSCERWDSSKRPPSRASSADRWDAHKKPRAAVQADAESERTAQEISKDKETEEEMTATHADLVFSGPSFFVASPEPSKLPMPAFFPRRAGLLPLQAH